MARKPGVRRELEGDGGYREVAPAAPPSPAREAPVESAASEWPAWARGVASAVVAIHIAAVVGGAMGVPPSSRLERWFADLFTWHHGLLDQGYAYRYYAEPPPTPIVVATLHKADGSDEKIRLPEVSVPGPPMRRQRQLALANALFASTRPHADHEHDHDDAAESWLARSYARHLGRTHPGTSSVTIKVQQHLIPTPDQVLESLEEFGRFDLFGGPMFTTPRWIGDFPCDGS